MEQVEIITISVAQFCAELDKQFEKQNEYLDRREKQHELDKMILRAFIPLGEVISKSKAGRILNYHKNTVAAKVKENLIEVNSEGKPYTESVVNYLKMYKLELLGVYIERFKRVGVLQF